MEDNVQLIPPFDRMADLVKSHGYPLEEHFVTTEDGYILRLFRVKHGRRPPFDSGPADAASTGCGGEISSSSSSSRGGHVNHNNDHATASGSRVGAGSGSSSGRSAGCQKGRRKGRRPVVHLQHGLLGASSDWALNGPGFSLVFILADAGYDVWLGNVRANAYSRNHTSLGPADPGFWAFTWDDMALKDLPAMLQTELDATGASSLSYVGHSQGTTIAMALLSSSQYWCQRVNLAVLLAPVAFATHVASPPLVALATLDTDELFTLLGIMEFLPSSEILSRLDGQLCRLEPHMCVNILAMICGYNVNNVDLQRLPIYLNYTPSGTSVANMAHWSQAIRCRDQTTMRRFDYGTRCTTILGQPRACNQKMYGQVQPPRYNLSSITTPLALFTGGNDRLADPADVELLLGQLPHDYIIKWHNDYDYAHLDYLWGVNAHWRVYAMVLEVLQLVSTAGEEIEAGLQHLSGGGGSSGKAAAVEAEAVLREAGPAQRTGAAGQGWRTQNHHHHHQQQQQQQQQQQRTWFRRR